MRRLRTLTLSPFVLAALGLAIFIYVVAQTSGITMAMCFAFPLVGLLALGGFVMNLIPRSGKRKPRDAGQLKQADFDPSIEYTLTDDGELTEVITPKPKRGSNR